MLVLASGDKQDCERKAFKRLAERLRHLFVRLPLLTLADGLYPYEEFFEVCQANGWAFCVTFKDGNLPTVWQEVKELQPLQPGQTRTETRHLPNQGGTITQGYQWVTAIDYQRYTLQWIGCEETRCCPHKQPDGTLTEVTDQARFVHLTNLPITHQTAVGISQTGRLRQLLERSI